MGSKERGRGSNKHILTHDHEFLQLGIQQNRIPTVEIPVVLREVAPIEQEGSSEIPVDNSVGATSLAVATTSEELAEATAKLESTAEAEIAVEKRSLMLRDRQRASRYVKNVEY